jgi:hypothetical protein
VSHVKGMSYQTVSSEVLFPMLRCLLPAACFAASVLAQTPGPRLAAASGSRLRARVVLGLEGVANNASGDLSIQNNAIVFSRREGATIRTPLSAIQGVFLSEQDKQVGGIPLALGKAAVPYSGGRVIGLFSHKKYGFLTVESFDVNGGLHATIYQLNRGPGEALANELAATGVHVSGLRIDVANREVEANNAK